MRLRVLIAILLAASSFLQSQTASTQKVYSQGSEQTYTDMVADTSGFALVGFQSGNVPFLLKLDPSGNFLWQQDFAFPDYTFFSNIIVANDGGYLLAGRVVLPAPFEKKTLLLLKTDGDGNPLWSTVLDADARIENIIGIPDGYVLAGAQNGDTFGNTDGALMQIDNDGNLAWSRTYGVYPNVVKFNALVKQNDRIWSAATVTPGPFVALVGSDYNSGFVDVAKRIDMPFAAQGKIYLHPSGNQSCLMAGSRQDPQGISNAARQPWVKKTDANGAVLWTKTYRTPVSESLVLRNAIACPDSGLLLLATANNVGTGGAATAIKLDANGQVQWSHYFGSDRAETLHLGYAQPDGRFTLAGNLDNNTSPGANIWPLYFVQTDSLGLFADCCNQNLDISAESHDEPSSDWFVGDGTFLQEATAYSVPGLSSKSFMAQDYCPPSCADPLCDVVLDFGPDLSLCKDSIFSLAVGSTFPQVLWQDGSTGNEYQVTTAGSYWVAVTDSCGVVQTDTIQVMVAPSALHLDCPTVAPVTAAVNATTATVPYPAPTITGDCSCGVDPLETIGLSSGSAFPIGQSVVCFSASDGCGNTASCCTTIEVLAPETACDVKETVCIRFELLNIAVQPDQSKTVRLRITNKCSSGMAYVAFGLPAGLQANMPNNSIYTSAAGNDYLVRNPNFAPFYSIRFKTVSGNGLSGGSADILEYTLPPQATPDYVYGYARLNNGAYYETHLSTYGCYATASKPQATDRNSTQTGNARLYPNPSSGIFQLDLQDWQEQVASVQIINSVGSVVMQQNNLPTGTVVRMQLPDGLPVGMYAVRLSIAGQPIQVFQLILTD
ncbi:MAG: HYR domain-containing protein [Lewinellaceae bacterium]|nr:HYR domain-containing protein [Lewinellaceae bacterium]